MAKEELDRAKKLAHLIRKLDRTISETPRKGYFRTLFGQYRDHRVVEEIVEYLKAIVGNNAISSEERYVAMLQLLTFLRESLWLDDFEKYYEIAISDFPEKDRAFKKEYALFQAYIGNLEAGINIASILNEDKNELRVSIEEIYELHDLGEIDRIGAEVNALESHESISMKQALDLSDSKENRIEALSKHFLFSVINEDFVKATSFFATELEAKYHGSDFKEFVAILKGFNQSKISIELTEIEFSWPSKKLDDVAWVYLSIMGILGDESINLIEGVTLIISSECEVLRIREIEWGRP